MSTTEQEVHGQIAEMRESLQTIRTSLRRGTLVRFLGLLVGLLIVAFFIWSFWTMGRDLVATGELQTEFTRQIEQIPVQRIASVSIEQAGPVYLEEVQALLAELGLEEALAEELDLAMMELEPVLSRELERIRPRLTTALQARGEALLVNLESELKDMLMGRLEGIVRRQQHLITDEVDLTPEQVEEILLNVIEANQDALLTVVERRWHRIEGDVFRIGELALEFPELPTMTEAQILAELRDVLMALIKYRLPDYEFRPEVALEPRPEVQLPPVEQLREMPDEALEALFDRLQMPEEDRQAIRERIEQE